MSKEKLDKNKPYGLIRGGGDARYLQGKNLYNFYGEKCGEVPDAFVKTKKTPVAEQAPKPKSRKEEALERAAAKLGDLGVASAPMGLADIKKENAKALAAEESAE